MTKPKPLRVLQLGESQILLQLARSVKDCRSSAMQKLIGRMIETCRSSSLVGLSAPQVGRSIRLFIILSKPTLAYPDAPLMIEPIVVVNPEFLNTSPEMEEGWEGCGSLPGIRGRISRYSSVSVAFIDGLTGERRSEIFRGFIARIFQHENDHLLGISFHERVKRGSLYSQRAFERKLRREQSKSKSKL